MKTDSQKPQQPNMEYELERLEPEQYAFDQEFFPCMEFDLEEEQLKNLGLDDFDRNEEFSGCEAVTEKKKLQTDCPHSNIHLHVLSGLGSAACMLLLAVILYHGIWQLHPGIKDAESKSGSRNFPFSDEVENYALAKMQQTKGIYLATDQVIHKTYKIPADAVTAMEPNPDCFGSIRYDYADLTNQVIDRARDYGLLGQEEKMVFQTDADFYKRGEIKYYIDETIMVLCWKEYIEGKIVSITEVKLRDASQFRRKLTGDTFGSGTEMFCTQLAAQTNAVVACNADYYAFRNLGLSCYNGQVMRYGQQNYGSGKLYNCLDSLFIDGNGDFRFFERNTEMSQEEIEQYMKEIGATFSLSFGPVLVKDGVAQYNQTYPIGQITELYSRAGIGQIDKLHYIYVVISNSGKGSPRATTDGFADLMVQKGAYNAYNLDGGQTGEFVFQNKIESLVDFGNERTVSDMIYFGSALPKEDWEKFTLQEKTDSEEKK